jgi:glyoxylase-like metal-dependent hydrolase (beta-lactamase superfamily II)
MRYSIILILLLTVLTCFTWHNAAWAAEVSTAKYEVGKTTVWAIADSISERDMGVFPDADQETISKYVPSGKCPSAVMVFLVKTGNEMVMIDAGMGAPSGERMSRLFDGLKEIGVNPEEITIVLITHMHGDHIGGLIRNGERAFPSARLLISRIEHDFWLDEKSPELFPQRRAGFEMARNIVELYGNSSQTFEFDTIVAPDIRAIDTIGHTPGNTAFLLESEGERILFWGDLVHAAALQFPRPDINAQFDMDPDKAAATRKLFMEKAAEEKLPVAGAHLPFPGIVEIAKDPEGGYIYKSY